MYVNTRKALEEALIKTKQFWAQKRLTAGCRQWKLTSRWYSAVGRARQRLKALTFRIETVATSNNCTGAHYRRAALQLQRLCYVCRRTNLNTRKASFCNTCEKLMFRRSRSSAEGRTASDDELIEVLRDEKISARKNRKQTRGFRDCRWNNGN